MEDVARRPLRAWVLAALYAGLIFALSSRSLDGLPAGPFLHVDKLVHAIEYGVLGALIAVALGGPEIGLGRALLALALAAAYGATDEWHQSFVPGRQPSIGDVVADTAGAAAAIFLVSRRRRRRKD